MSSGAAPPIFADDFSSGDFVNWTSNTRLTIDNATGSPAAPSARAQVTNQSASAYKDLASPYMTACTSLNVNVIAGSNIDLFRLRTAANGAIIKVFVATNGTLQIRSDFAGDVVQLGRRRWAPGSTTWSSAARSARTRPGTSTATASRS